MKIPKKVAVGVALAASATALAPVAGAGMLLGNYEDHTPRDPGHSWLWSVRECGLDQTINTTGCVHVAAIPRPNGQATPWNADAHLVNGRYTLVVVVQDVVRLTVSFLP